MIVIDKKDPDKKDPDKKGSGFTLHMTQDFGCGCTLILIAITVALFLVGDKIVAVIKAFH